MKIIVIGANGTIGSSIGRSHVYDEIKAGRLRAVKSGKRTLIQHEDAARWAKALPEFNSESAA
jgi:excisionase family DNA binding protein